MNKLRVILLTIATILTLPAAYYLPAKPALDAFVGGSSYIIICALAFALLCGLFAVLAAKGRILALPSLLSGGILLIGVALMFGIGWFVVKFLSGIINITAFVGAPALIIALFLLIFIKLKKKAGTQAASISVRRSAESAGEIKFDLKLLFGALIALFICGIIALILGKESYYLFIPGAAVVLSFLLLRVFRMRIFVLLGYIVVEFYALACAAPAIAAMTDNSFILELVLTIAYMSVLAPLADLYCREGAIA